MHSFIHASLSIIQQKSFLLTCKKIKFAFLKSPSFVWYIKGPSYYNTIYEPKYDCPDNASCIDIELG